MADVNFGSQKVIDVKPVRSRQKKKIVLYLILLAVLLWVGLIAALTDKYYYHYLIKPPAKRIVSENIDPAPPPHDSASRVDIFDGPLPPPPAPGNDKQEQIMQENMKPAMSALEKRVDNLEMGNRNLIVYFAARDLKDSLDDAGNFKEQLEFLKEALTGDLNVSGKIDILEQATSNGLVTKAKLLAELKILQKNMEQNSDRGFSGSIKSAFGNLVKITKTEGEVKAGDYNSILKRAEIALSKPRISGDELQAVINEVKTLGKPADEFVKQANNLARVLEVTDYLVIYTKSKTLAKNG